MADQRAGLSENKGDGMTLLERFACRVIGRRSPTAAAIVAERLRQMDVEGWTPEHDRKHSHGELLAAALCYLDSRRRDRRWRVADHRSVGGTWEDCPPTWPWEASWWKPSSDRTRELVKAGALVAADGDRRVG